MIEQKVFALIREVIPKKLRISHKNSVEQRNFNINEFISTINGYIKDYDSLELEDEKELAEKYIIACVADLKSLGNIKINLVENTVIENICVELYFRKPKNETNLNNLIKNILINLNSLKFTEPIELNTYFYYVEKQDASYENLSNTLLVYRLEMKIESLLKINE